MRVDNTAPYPIFGMATMAPNKLTLPKAPPIHRYPGRRRKSAGRFRTTRNGGVNPSGKERRNATGATDASDAPWAKSIAGIVLSFPSALSSSFSLVRKNSATGNSMPEATTSVPNSNASVVGAAAPPAAAPAPLPPANALVGADIEYYFSTCNNSP